MQSITKNLKDALLTPIRSLRRRYIPLLIIYFAYGAQALTSVALTFWEKENLSLSSEQLIAIAVWVSMPWTLKMIIGQLIDVVPIFGSRRKAWIFIGAGFMALGYCILYGMSIEAPWVTWLGGQYTLYLLSSLVMATGFLIQDATADAMSTEVADRSQDEESVRQELAMIQILGRLSLMIAWALTVGLGGWLAQSWSYEQVFLLALCIPVLSIVGALFIRLDTADTSTSFNPIIISGGVIFGIFTVIMAFSDVPFSQEIVFVVSLCLLCFMLRDLLKQQDPSLVKDIVLAFIVIFLFRAVPSVGPGYNWWAIDILGFDEAFFGVLGQISSTVALVILWLASSYIASKPLRAVMLLLVVFTALFEIPNFMLYYGVHDTLGVSARTVALFDTVLESPLVYISMIPMLALIAYYAPAANRATWFAVAASLMNLSLTAAQLLTKYLNQLFVVSREIKDDTGLVITPQDYSELGWLLWSVLLIGFCVPYLAIVFFLKSVKPDEQAAP